MLKTLTLENFTVFAKAELEFSPGINVIIGENGTGKTHLLKAGYCFSRAWPDLVLGGLKKTIKLNIAEAYFEKRLMGLFQSEHMANLIRRGKKEGHLSAKVAALIPGWHINNDIQIEKLNLGSQSLDGLTKDLLWELSIRDSEELNIAIPVAADPESEVAKSIFVPSKEIVSFYEGLGGLLDEYKIRLDITYRDMASNFDFPELRNPLELSIVEEFDSILGGRLELEGRRLIFVDKNGYKMETPLLAEGFRKLAMLPYFIRHGLIRGYREILFWDEPEANLNSRLIIKLAEALVVLARHNVQVILATHSLLLLKEIDLQLQLAAEANNPVPARFFALSLDGENGVKINAGDELDAVDPIAALDMEIDQADRYQEWYDRASRAE